MDERMHHLDQLWKDLNFHMPEDGYPLGWDIHLLVILKDVCITLDCAIEAMQPCFVDLKKVLDHWQEAYPDPTLFGYLICLRRFRPTLFLRYQEDYQLPTEDPAYQINGQTFPLVQLIHHMLMHNPNPMRMKEYMAEEDHLIEQFMKQFSCRFIAPFDCRTTEEIYMMTGHLEEIFTALKRLD
ncbi:hypothetical protein ACQZV8_17245 [Magnetococcales bacterium HHB-1]